MTLWTIGFIAGAAVVVVVAVLLIGIILQAQKILRLALVASDVVGQIDVQTRSVWALRDTNNVAAQLLEGARAIDANAAAIARVLTASHDARKSA